MHRVVIMRPTATQLVLSWSIAWLSMLSVLTASAAAIEISVQGLSFSDEKGGFHLISVTGQGTPEDPITITEEVTGPAEPVLVIRGFSASFGNRTRSFHTASFAMKKVAINHTNKPWRSYRVELREVETRPSNYEDGLSFGQGTAVADSFTKSPIFPDAERINEPEDSITFSGNEVPPGGTATMFFIVSDMSPVHRFFLLQHPTDLISEKEMPTPIVKLATERETGWRQGY